MDICLVGTTLNQDTKYWTKYNVLNSGVGIYVMLWHQNKLQNFENLCTFVLLLPHIATCCCINIPECPRDL